MPEQQVGRLLGPKDLQLDKGDSLNAVVAPPIESTSQTPLTNSERLKRKKEAQRRVGGGSAKKWLLSLAGVAGLTIVPQLFPQVRNFESDLFNGESIPPTINDASLKETFPNILIPDNFEVIAPNTESLQAQNQSIDLERMVGAVGFPIDVNTINSTPTIRFAGSFGGELPPGVTKDATNGVQDIVKITGLPKGTIIYAPVEGGVLDINASGVKEEANGQTFVSAYTTLSFRFVDKEGNHGIVTLSVLGGRPLIDIPPFSSVHKHPLNTDGTQVKLFQPVIVMDSDTLVNIDPNNYSVSGQVGQVTMQVIYDNLAGDLKPLPLQLDFLRQNDSKIIVPQEE